MAAGEAMNVIREVVSRAVALLDEQGVLRGSYIFYWTPTWTEFGAPAPQVDVVRQAVLQAVAEVGGERLTMRTGRYFPGAIGEGWHIRVSME